MLAPRLVLVSLLALAALSVPVARAQAAECPGAGLQPSAGNLAEAAQATLCLINAARTAAGLVPLRENASLTALSTAYSEDLVANKYFDHVSSRGVTLVQRLAAMRYDWRLAAENLAWGERERGTPAQIVDAWMQSESHRVNILNGGLREIGVGIAVGAPVPDRPQSATYTTDFGTPPVPAPIGRFARTTRLAAAAALNHRLPRKRRHRRTHRHHRPTHMEWRVTSG